LIERITLNPPFFLRSFFLRTGNAKNGSQDCLSHEDQIGSKTKKKKSGSLQEEDFSLINDSAYHSEAFFFYTEADEIRMERTV
ncbi:MAG: hypothetical protein J6S26_00045, partial [Solobacterium sp.]|nr:hypothetical protein [Solobacterium sp.]